MHVHDVTTAAERRAHLDDLDYVEEANQAGKDRLANHLREDHGLNLYDDDDPADLLVMHDGAHRAPAPEPTAPPQPEVPQAVQEARAEVELYRLHQAEKAYDVDMPSTLRERMAYARSLASSALIPKAFRSGRGGDDGFRETTANVLLAVELGNTLGLSPLQALCQVNVVEGKPGLGAEGQLAQVLKAGHDMYVDEERSDRTKATVVAQRTGSDRVHTITYTLDDAVAAGLVRIVDGKPYARSQSGKALPWETSTPDMLVWRAVTRACKRVFPDVTGGLAVVEDEPGTQYAPTGGATTTAAQEVPARARPSTVVGSVEADLALFDDSTGAWWTHAGAEVRRRNKLQLAADRLNDAMVAGDERVPTPTYAYVQGAEVVDAEVVEDPTVTPAEAGPLADDDLGTTPAVVVDVAAEADALAEALASEPAQTVPAEAQEVPRTDPAADPWQPDEAQQPTAQAPADPPPATLDRAQLWDAITAMAEERGKTVVQLLARHVLATRVNPEDMTAEQLQAFLSAQRGL